MKHSVEDANVIVRARKLARRLDIVLRATERPASAVAALVELRRFVAAVEGYPDDGGPEAEMARTTWRWLMKGPVLEYVEAAQEHFREEVSTNVHGEPVVEATKIASYLKTHPNTRVYTEKLGVKWTPVSAARLAKSKAPAWLREQVARHMGVQATTVRDWLYRKERRHDIVV